MLTKPEIEELIDTNKIIIRPLLDREKQLGELTIDLRLGTDFLVSNLSRNPYINIDSKENVGKCHIQSYFSKTRRLLGEQIVLYPNQTVLASTLEYIKLPKDISCKLYMRSSYGRLGLSLSTIIHAGYCGCLSIELTNTNTNIIKLTTGTRIVQVAFYNLSQETEYFSRKRKYLCQVRPMLSAAQNDTELSKLAKLRNEK